MKHSGEHYDAVIAGTGPGGATIARDLSMGGEKVLMLEWGDNKPIKGTAAQSIPRSFVPGRSLMITGQMLGIVRGITTGGSSVFYCATAFDPPVDMLRSYGVDISSEVAEIREELPIETLSDDLMSPAGARFLKGAVQLGYDARKLNKFIYQDKCRPNCDKCSYGCPEGAKWSARHFVAEAERNGATLVTGAKVEQVLTENGRAVGLRYRHKGVSKQVRGSTVIVAAGGIGSPLILRNSGFQGVGKDFFFDPLWFVFGKVKDGGGGKGVQMCAGIHFVEDGIVMTDLNMSHLFKSVFDAEVMRLDQVFSHGNVVPIMIKVRDGLGGRITDRGQVSKPLRVADMDKLKKGKQHATRILRHLGAKTIYSSWLFAAHPGGTVKIGEQLDSNLQTRLDGLYVCDCSVIPKEWGLPPTFTILALARRLSKYLLN